MEDLDVQHIDAELLRKHAATVKEQLAAEINEARVRGYTRRTKTGKTVQVRDFERRDRLGGDKGPTRAMTHAALSRRGLLPHQRRLAAKRARGEGGAVPVKASNRFKENPAIKAARMGRETAIKNKVDYGSLIGKRMAFKNTIASGDTNAYGARMSGIFQGIDKSGNAHFKTKKRGVMIHHSEVPALRNRFKKK